MSYYEPKTYELQNAGQSWSVASNGDNMRFEVRSGDKWANDSTGKERSEIASYNKLSNDQYYTVSYKFMIEPGDANTADWLLMGQIHQTEDAVDKGVSPPFAIQLVGERMQIVVRSDPNAVTVANPATTVIYEDEADIQRGAWYDMDIQVEFDPKGEGHVNVWRNNILIAQYSGPLGYVDAIGPYWKNGIYRSAAPEQIAINYTDVEVATGAVTPPGAITPTGPIQTITASTTTTLGVLGKGLILTGSANINGYGNGYDNNIVGNAGANILKGYAGDDVLTSYAGNDTLDGGAGADAMYGGLGDDNYYVDNVGDIVKEAANEGTDWVFSSITYSLTANVEFLTLTGSDAINGMGNNLSNRIYGNAAANSLTGNDGDDLLVGGGGDDTLSGGNGNDTLDGGDGNDNLYGGAGIDTMRGGAGNDTYTVDNTGDVVVEAADGGNDSVMA
ncbi:heparin lyase I family protein, partial [Caulobacter segnis]